jgi:U4/U6 small nuclear ribonucleoprotein PRP4
MTNKTNKVSTSKVVDQQKEVVYSAATEEMISIRKFLAVYSFQRSQQRIVSTNKVRSSEKGQLDEDRRASELYSHCREIALSASQFVGERPATCVRYSTDGNLIASSSLGALVRVWDSSTLNLVHDLKGHEERVTSVAWHPERNHILASTSADSKCILWDASKAEGQLKNVLELKGHQGAVLYCDFHPSGRLLGTCGTDTTWHLWDVETGTELLLQDGHFKECSSISFQQDGGLALSTDWAGVALMWDLRSGQMVQAFQGHIKKITCSTFHPNCYQVATGSVDNMIRIWDLRKRKCGYCLPAHTSVISEVRYSRSGEVLLSSSFDGTVKLWGSRDFQLLRALSGHSGKVMSADISYDETHIVSAGYDRTVKLWAHKSEI